MWLDFPYSELRKKEAKYEICNVKRSKILPISLLSLGLPSVEIKMNSWIISHRSHIRVLVKLDITEPTLHRK